MMKQMMRILAAVMVIMMIFAIAPSAGLFGVELGIKADAASYKVGDHIQFGTYPQSRVKSKALIQKLEAVEKVWKSYGYYCGKGEQADGAMKPSDYMTFSDFIYDDVKYRAVKFSKFRPSQTGSFQTADNTYQVDNNYKPGNIYYFKYEPLSWRVLNPKEHIVICERIIDAQAYQNTLYEADDYSCWQDKTKTVSANSYKDSSIRRWLGYDFYETAFNDSQKANIKTDTLPNDYLTVDYDAWEFDYEAENCVKTKEKVWLFGFGAMMNTNYRFDADYSEYDPDRQAKGTDYAKSQGLWVNPSGEYKGNSPWWLRTASYYSDSSTMVSNYGYIELYCSVNCTYVGVRPACMLKKLKNDTAENDVLFSEIPAAPHTLKASSVKGTSFKLSWNKVLNAAGYVVYQYNPKTMKYVKLKATKNTSFVVTNLNPKTTYRFEIRVYSKSANGKVYSNYSNPINVKTK